MSTLALERLPLTQAQMARLLSALDLVLAEAGRKGWTDAEKEEAERLALEWIERIRKRRAAREAARLQEAKPDTFTPEEARELYQEMATETAAKMAATAAQVGADEITPHQFYLDMERYITMNARAAYIAGKVSRGGSPKLSKAEEKALWAWREEQVRYLGRFYQDVRDGRSSAAQTAARAQMYADAIKAPYNQGQAHAFGDLHLAQVPGDGKTKCRTRCHCVLEYEPVYESGKLIAVNVYWRLRPAEHCDDCVALAARWNPLRVEV